MPAQNPEPQNLALTAVTYGHSQRLRDSAQIHTLPEWLRHQLKTAADHMDELAEKLVAARSDAPDTLVRVGFMRVLSDGALTLVLDKPTPGHHGMVYIKQGPEM